MGGRIWKFLNSPFGLWFMSAIALGLVSAAYSSGERCRERASVIEQEVDRVLAEMVYRRSIILETIRRAEAAADLERAAVFAGTEAPSMFVEFQGRRLLDVEAVFFLKLVQEIDATELFGASEDAPQFVGVTSFHEPRLRAVTDSDLAQFKAAHVGVGTLPKWVAQIHLSWKEPNCSLWSLTKRAFGADVPTLKLTKGPFMDQFLSSFDPDAPSVHLPSEFR